MSVYRFVVVHVEHLGQLEPHYLPEMSIENYPYGISTPSLIDAGHETSVFQTLEQGLLRERKIVAASFLHRIVPQVYLKVQFVLVHTNPTDTRSMRSIVRDLVVRVV